MTSKKIQITIDGKKIFCKEGQTVLEVARDNDIFIPTMCYHSDLEVKANCRICLVEIEGKNGLHTSCSLKATTGMKVKLNTPEVKKARETNLQLIFAQHREECNDCVWHANCSLLNLQREWKIKPTRFKDRKNEYPVYEFGPSLLFDSSKCIDCRNCVEMCEKQGVGFLEVKEKGHLFQVCPTNNPEIDCIYCGQCLVHCPVGAFEAIGEYEDVEKPLNQPGKKVVFQFAPSIRAVIGEEFDMPHGSVVTDQLSAAIRQLGVDRVFDVSVGADFTTVEEAGEIVEKIGTDKVPNFTSCCPAWVKFVEFNYPEFIPNLATTRSPHVLMGGLIKTQWAKKEGINPKDIYVVSIMPCVAKKYEITRPELAIDGIKPVDYVLTTRELADLFKKKKIDLKTVKPEPSDNPLGEPTGSGVIYGASGGVAEAALRTAYEKVTGKHLKKVKFEMVRGLEGVKKAEVDIEGTKVKVAVINGLGNVIPILEELKKDPKAYDVVEVMACPGGCIGGGGQPIPTDGRIRKKRAEALYRIDDSTKIRSGHHNPIVEKLYEEFFTTKEIIHKVFHTKYHPKKKEVVFNKKNK